MPRAELGEYKECTWFAAQLADAEVEAIWDPAWERWRAFR